MANYSVDIAVALKGAKELQKLRKEINAITQEVKGLNKPNIIGNRFPKTINNLSQSVNKAKAALNDAAVGTKTFNNALKTVVKVEEEYSKQLKKKNRALQIERIAQKKGISFQKAKILLTKQEAEAEAKLAAQKAKTAKAERNRRIGGTISSAAIGGAFPLLFGQTGAAAVGGGLGGLAGGAIGGQFGFALSIVGTAIGSAIDKNEKFNKSLAALNIQFTATSGGTQILAADVDKLAKRLNVTKEEAIAALSAFKEFGSSSIAKSLVSIFGTDAGAFDTLAAINRQAALAQQIFQARKQIGNQVAKQLLQQNLVNDASVIELALAEAKAKAANDELIAKAKVVTLQDRILAGAASDGFNFVDPSIFGEERAAKIQKEFEEGRNKRIEDFKKALEEVREMLGLVNEANSQFGQSGVLAFSAINDKVKDLKDEMKALQNPIRAVIQVSDVMATSFEDSFKGIIRGTMTVADAFRNMLNKIADYFIDTAARMMANQLQQGILGLFGNLFSSTFISPNPTPTLTPDQQVSRFTFMKADGGPVMKGGSYIVGERGPELFSPGVSGMITPNHALGGSTNITVNVDASGSSVEGNEEQGRELGRMISVAIQSELVKQKRPGGMLA